MTEENFFNKKKSKTPVFKIPVKEDEKKSSKVAGATVGATVGLGTAGLIFNNKTNSQIDKINSSFEKKFLEVAKNGLTKEEFESLRAKGGILQSDGTGGVVMDKYKENLYNYIARPENWEGDNFKAIKEEQFSQEIKNAQKDAIGSLNIGERITSGFSNTIKSLGANSSIKEVANAINVSPDIVATSGIVSLITASIIGAGFAGKKIANSIFKAKKREESVRKAVEAQAKQENALKTQQAKVHMGTEFSPSAQTETVNER